MSNVLLLSGVQELFLPNAAHAILTVLALYVHLTLSYVDVFVSVDIVVSYARSLLDDEAESAANLFLDGGSRGFPPLLITIVKTATEQDHVNS